MTNYTPGGRLGLARPARPPSWRATPARAAGLLALAVGAAGVACGDEAKSTTPPPPPPGPTIKCGANTMLVGDTCVGEEIPPPPPPPDPVTCGEGSTLMGNVCVVNPAPERLVPGHFESPALKLQEIKGQIQHLHVDEVRYRASDKKVFQCSYTFAALNVADPANVAVLTDNNKYAFPGDARTNAGCLNLAWDEGHPDVIFVTHHGNISNSPSYLGGWELRVDPMTRRTSAVQIPTFREPETSYEGIDVANGNIYVGLHEKGLGVYTYDYTAKAFTRTATLADVQNAWGVRAVGDTVYVGDTEFGLAVVDVADPRNPALLSEIDVGGVARGLAVNGSTVYVAAGGAGLVIVDVSNKRQPRIVSSVPTPGAAIRVDYANNIAWVAAWDDVRAYDVSDPANPKFITAIRETEQATYTSGASKAGDLNVGRPPVTSRNLGVTAWDDFVIPGNWWLLRSYRVRPEKTAPSIRIPEDQYQIDFGTVEVGMTGTHGYDVYNQGNEPLTLFDMWVEHGNFDITPKEVRIMPGEKVTLGVTFTATSATQQWGVLHINSDDPMWLQRSSLLVGNRPGPAVGRPMIETKVNLFDGTQLNTTSLQGKVVVIAYFATF